MGELIENHPEGVEAHGIMSHLKGAKRERIDRIVEQLVKAHEAWETAEPGNGHQLKAAEWRARLATPTSRPGEIPKSSE